MSSLYIYQQIDLIGVKRRDTFSQSFEIGEEFDLTGHSAKCQVRESATSARVLVEMECDIDGQVVTIFAPASKMNIEQGRYVYDVQFVGGDGDVQTLFGGLFTTENDVTK